MLPTTLRITLCIAVIIYFVVILYYLKNKMLELKYTLIWIVAGVVVGVMIFFPTILMWFAHLLGIQSNMNALFVLAIAFVIMVLMTLTSIASRMTNKIKTLTQEMAIIEKRIRDLESKDIRE